MRLPILVAAGIALLSARVEAAPRAAALPPVLRGNPSTELRDRFHEAVTRGLYSGGVEIIPAAEVRLRGGASCDAPGPCDARAAANLRVDHTLATEVVIAGTD